MKKTIIAVCTFIGLLEFAMVVIYFVVFNGGISTTNQDWDTFIQIFNGFIMTILTAVNIYVFYHLTVVIENKNQERAVKEKVFEAQSVITQMRIKQYEDVRTLIYKAIETIARNKEYNENMDLLHRKIVELEDSFLFKNYNLKDSSMLGDESLTIGKFINLYKADANNVNKEDFIKSLINYIKLMEIYIIGQMTTTDNDVASYVKDNIFNTDCTISCVVQIFNNTLEKLRESKSEKTDA